MTDTNTQTAPARPDAAAVRAVYDQLLAAGRYASATEVRDLNPAAFAPKLVRAEVVDPWHSDCGYRLRVVTYGALGAPGVAVKVLDEDGEDLGVSFNRDRLRAALAMLTHPKLTPDGLWPEGTQLQLDPPPPDELAEQLHGVTWLLIRDGQVLLERCEKKRAKLGMGEWFVPGGKIESGETAEQALAREIAEEWPWADVLQSRPLPVVEGSRVGAGPDGLFLMRPFAVTVGGDAPEVSAEGTPLRWVPLTEVMRSPVPQVRMMVSAAIRELPPDEGESVEGEVEFDPMARRTVAVPVTWPIGTRVRITPLKEG